jgi:NitT/TauT family transport system substrate-binding protein
MGSAALLATVGPVAAQGKAVTVVLNWVPQGDHAPIYWAVSAGKYKEAGLDVTVENGRGSGFSVQRVGAGAAALGISDMATVLEARSKGANVVGVMAIYAQSPFGIYWKKSSGVKTIKDLKGKRIGAPPADAARQMWPAIARAVGLEPADVTWVNIAPEAKVASLQSGAIDATTHFYNVHYIYERTFGADMGFVALRDVGFNPHGNALIVNQEFLNSNRDAVAKFVGVTQRAYANCVADYKPCGDVLAKAASSTYEEALQNWTLTKVLMTNEATTTVALGWFDPARMERDAAMVTEVFKTPSPVKAADAYTNDFLDKSVKMKR